jgi:hypothetical protein
MRAGAVTRGLLLSAGDVPGPPSAAGIAVACSAGPERFSSLPTWPAVRTRSSDSPNMTGRAKLTNISLCVKGAKTLFDYARGLVVLMYEACRCRKRRSHAASWYSWRSPPS